LFTKKVPLLLFPILILILSGSIFQAKAETTEIDSDTIIKSMKIEVGDILKINSEITVSIMDKFQNFGIIQNHGTILIRGILENQMSGEINNNFGGTIQTLEGGTLNSFVGSTIGNSGMITNQGTINIYGGGIITNKEGGILNNENFINNFGGVIINYGTIDNKIQTSIINQGTIINKGAITNSGTITNKKTISNNLEGTITNHPQGTIINQGTLGNFGGLITNIAGIINTIGGSIINHGTIYSCDGVFEGISGVMYNTILFDCEKKNEVDEKSDSDSAKSQSTTSSSESTSQTIEEQKKNTGSQQICGPGSIIKDGMCVDESVNPQQVKGRIPEKVKNIIALWADGHIGSTDFFDGIRSLVYDKIIDVPEITSSKTPGGGFVPQWFSHTAGWWSEGLISEDEFINAAKFLLQKEIIRI